MKQINVKKLLLPNIPYVFIAFFATKLGQAARLAPGADFSQKALHIMEGYIAEKSGGASTVTYQNGVFSAKVMLCGEKQPPETADSTTELYGKCGK